MLEPTLFEKVVRASRLESIIAPFTVRQVCAAEGFVGREMTSAVLIRILPSLETALSLRLEEKEPAEAMAELQALGELRR